MSSYYVAGVPAGKVERMVKKATARQERRLKRCPTPESTQRRAEKHRARILANPPREQISPEFDAPQFCREWIRLAEKSGFSHMVIVEPK